MAFTHFTHDMSRLFPSTRARRSRFLRKHQSHILVMLSLPLFAAIIYGSAQTPMDHSLPALSGKWGPAHHSSNLFNSASVHKSRPAVSAVPADAALPAHGEHAAAISARQSWTPPMSNPAELSSAWQQQIHSSVQEHCELGTLPVAFTSNIGQHRPASADQLLSDALTAEAESSRLVELGKLNKLVSGAAEAVTPPVRELLVATTALAIPASSMQQPPMPHTAAVTRHDFVSSSNVGGGMSDLETLQPFAHSADMANGLSAGKSDQMSFCTTSTEDVQSVAKCDLQTLETIILELYSGLIHNEQQLSAAAPFEQPDITLWQLPQKIPVRPLTQSTATQKIYPVCVYNHTLALPVHDTETDLQHSKPANNYKKATTTGSFDLQGEQ